MEHPHFGTMRITSKKDKDKLRFACISSTERNNVCQCSSGAVPDLDTGNQVMQAVLDKLMEKPDIIDKKEIYQIRDTELARIVGDCKKDTALTTEPNHNDKKTLSRDSEDIAAGKKSAEDKQKSKDQAIDNDKQDKQNSKDQDVDNDDEAGTKKRRSDGKHIEKKEKRAKKKKKYTDKTKYKSKHDDMDADKDNDKDRKKDKAEGAATVTKKGKNKDKGKEKGKDTKPKALPRRKTKAKSDSAKKTSKKPSRKQEKSESDNESNDGPCAEEEDISKADSDISDRSPNLYSSDSADSGSSCSDSAS